ncbi:MAG TPA: hypothetical protein VFQ77_14580 [Pseudonocardiaceae bacterium]|nr:hypothetical protein [Pseudonocardiaceae bacterium]
MIRNFTPHDVHLATVAGRVRVPPDGPPARIRQRAVPVGRVAVHDTEIELFDVHDGGVDGLPDPQPGVYLVVPRVVAYACPERRDLVFPYQEVRDENGRVIGCAALGRTLREGR